MRMGRCQSVQGLRTSSCPTSAVISAGTACPLIRLFAIPQMAGDPVDRVLPHTNARGQQNGLERECDESSRAGICLPSWSLIAQRAISKLKRNN